MASEMYLVLKDGSRFEITENCKFPEECRTGTLMGGIQINVSDDYEGLNLYDDFNCVMDAAIQIPETLFSADRYSYMVAAWNEKNIEMTIENDIFYFNEEPVGPKSQVFKELLSLAQKWAHHEARLYGLEKPNQDILDTISELEDQLDSL